MCCQCIRSDYGFLRDKSGKILTVNDDIETARNTELLKSVRKSLLAGKQHPACQLCWDEERIGVNSIRKLANDRKLFTLSEAKQVTGKEGTIPTNIPFKYYDLRMGNFCNMKCRYCNPGDSSLWVDDWIKLQGTKEFIDKDKPAIQLDEHSFEWGDNPRLISHIKKIQKI